MPWALAFLLGLLSQAWALGEVERAREAVKGWLRGAFTPPLESLLRAPREELPRLLEAYAHFPPPPPGLQVNLDRPRVEGERVLFPAALGGEGGEVVVRLEGGNPVGIAFRPQGLGPPAYLLRPAAGWAFLLLSLLLLALLLQPGPLRAWLGEAWALLRAHLGVYLLTNALLYGLFALGAFLAYLEPALARALQALLAGALEALGLEGVRERGVMTLAGVIFYWNLTQGLLWTGLLPGLLLGLPVLFLNLARYLLFGLALSPALLGPAFLPHLPTLVLELQAYILVSFGGVLLFLKTLRGPGYREGVRALLLSAFLGALFLLLAAWYEAWEVIHLL